MGVPGNANALLLRSAAAAGGYQVSRSLRFNSSDSAYLSRTPASAGNRKTWTWAGWVKRSGFAAFNSLFGSYDGSTGSTYFSLIFTTSDTLRVEDISTVFRETTQVFRDPSAWYHIVLAVDTTAGTASNRVRLYVNGTEVTAFNTSNNPTPSADLGINGTHAHGIGRPGAQAAYYFNGYLADIHFIDGQALTPSSFTEVSATTGQLIPKAYSGSFGTNGFWLQFADNSNNTAATLGKDTSGNGNNWTPNNITATELYGKLYRQATGTSTTAFSDANLVGSFPATSSVSSYIYDAELRTSVTSVTFGYAYSFSGVEVLVSNDGVNWTSKGTQSSSYTTVTHTSAFKYVRWYIAGTFTHGITNNPANIDSLVDTPTSYGTDTGAGGEVRGNYCTWNPLSGSLGTRTLSNGNLDTTNSANGNTYSTFELSSGKWYLEATLSAISGAGGATFIGFSASGGNRSGDNAQNLTPNVAYGADGSKIVDAASSSYGASYTSNDVIGIALDIDGGTVAFYKNGSSQGTISKTFLGAGKGTWALFTVAASGSASNSWSLNAGVRPFAYAAPSGFKALCDTNLPAPVVAKPSTVMDVALYTGNGSTQAISGLGFSPDLVWLKVRSAAVGHGLFDQVRGAGKALYSHATNAEYDYGTTSSGELYQFNSDGFNLGSFGVWNVSSQTSVAWCWDAGSSTVTNTQGSITSQVRANASAGFSIVTYTGNGSSGATIGHGLGVKPALIIAKNRDASDNWIVQHTSQGAGKAGYLNTTDAFFTSSFWNSTEPTSSVFSVGNQSNVNGSGVKLVAYAFSPVAGYSSAFSYSGSGSSDGPAVWLGFRPRLILIKRSDSTASWQLYDTARGTYNVVTQTLAANESTAESGFTSGYDLDILSTGFKIRAATSNAINSSGGTYIGFAWAESPFQYARAR